VADGLSNSGSGLAERLEHIFGLREKLNADNHSSLAAIRQFIAAG
jgi:hypothetical protein